MSAQRPDSNNIPLDFYTDNRILKWEVDATRIEDWFAALDAETRRLVSAAVEVLASRARLFDARLLER